MEIAVVGLLGLVFITLASMISYQMKLKEAFRHAFAKSCLAAGYTLIVITVFLNFMLVKILLQDLILSALLIGNQQ